MRSWTYLPHAAVCVSQVVVCAGQVRTGTETLKIPPVSTTLDVKGQPVRISAWGSVSAVSAGVFRLDVTGDLADFQENLTPVLRAQIDRSDRCGERLAVERGTLTPMAPAAVLTAFVHYERFGCAKAFGKEIVKRLVGGDGVVEVNLEPAVRENRVQLTAEVRRITADGTLGELLRSGALGDSIREKIAASIRSAVEKAADLHSTLSPAVEGAASLERVQFADGGSGRLWLVLSGMVRLSPEQFQAAAQALAR